jgi:protease I
MNELHSAPRIDGAKIAVVLESKFIPEEIWAYISGFPLLGAEVELISRIWYGDYKPASATFFSDADPTDSPAWTSPQQIEVRRDISQAHPSDYAAVIMAANYTSVRLRYPGEIPEDAAQLAEFDPWQHVQSAPVVRFFAEAMQDKKIVKGLLCHGLWILTPNPKLLRGRKVICHSVVMPDILNCGAVIALTPNRVVTDDDLVSGFSKHQVVPFMAAIAKRISDIRQAAQSASLVPMNPYA